MKKFSCFLLVILTLLITNADASHFMGYDMSITRIPNSDTYIVRLTIYKDNASGTAAMPTEIDFKTYVNNNNVNANVNFTVTRISLALATYNPADCPPASATLSLQVGVFEYTLTSAQALTLTNSSGYYFSADECCRNAGATNVMFSDQLGMNFALDIPSLAVGAATRYNSSPRFNKAPLTFYCIGKPYTIDWQCTDPDGDSLVFSLLRPTDGTSSMKPFSYGTYAPGYNFYYNIMDGSPDLTINPKTGIINFIPTKSGRYLIGFKVDEYRKINGVPKKIGTIYREFQIETVLCFETAPQLGSLNSNNVYVQDTIENVYDSVYTYTRNFIVNDSPGDSVFMKIKLLDQKDTAFNNRILWGNADSVLNGNNIEENILKGKISMTGRVEVHLDSTLARKAPYKFRILAFDKTCPNPLFDSIEVSLVVKEKNCTPTYENYTIYGCDSALANNGKWYTSSGLHADTITYSDGCKLITNYQVNLHTNIVHYYLGACDSVKGIGNNYYYTSGIYIDTIKSNVCDTINVFHVSVNQSPLLQNLIGDTVVSPAMVYQYFYTPSVGNTTEWKIKNGTLVASNMFSATVEWDTLAKAGFIQATEVTPNGCEVKAKLNVNILQSGIYNQDALFKIYPNPSSDKIWIEYTGVNRTLNASIFDVKGIQVMSFVLSTYNEIDLSEFAKGIYYIRIEDKAYKVLKY